MASYRPKSLDELNNLYGKAVSAEKARREGASLLGSDVLAPEAEKPQEEADVLSAPSEQKVESVSPDIDAFIRQFSSSDGRPVPLSMLTPNASVSSGNESQNPAKDEGITGLMDDYANVMTGAYDDEDDDEPKRNRFKQRKGKRKASKEITDDSLEQQEQSQPVEQDRHDYSFDSTYHENEPFRAGTSLLENDSAPEYGALQYEPPYGTDDESGDIPFEREENPQESFEFGDVSSVPKLSGGKLAAKILLIILLVFTLFATAATGACVLTVNSGRELGGYRFYTVERSDVKSGISTDDLILCKSADTFLKDENVVYYDAAGNRAVGKIIVANGNDTYNINISDVQKERIEGLAEKSIASLGKIVRTVSDSFLLILIGLVGVAIIITLVLCFAFKPRQSTKKKAVKQDSPIQSSDNEYPGHYDDELFDGIE